MNILVLGGNGFIGKRLCDRIPNREKVFSFDLNKPEKQIEGVEYIQGDFFDDKVLKNIIIDMDVVVYLIGILTPSNSNEKYKIGYCKEIPQLIKLCEWMKSNQKLVFISSGGTVYGNHEGGVLHEDMGTFPINHYGNVKLCMENIIRVFIKQKNMNAVIARVANPYGPGQDFKKGVGFIDAVIKNKMANQTVCVWGDGSIERDYIYIDDVCNMLYSLCINDTKDDIYNLSTGIGTSQNQIINYVSELLGEVSVQYEKGRVVDVNQTVLSNERILTVYDGKIRKVKSGIKEYIAYLNENTF